VDGPPFQLSVTSRTKRLRLYQHELATLDLAALTAAPNIEILETGYAPIAIATLAPIASLSALTNLSLSIPAGTDLSPLAMCPALRYLGLTLEGDGADLEPLSKMPALASLSLSQKNSTQVLDLSPLRARMLETVGISGFRGRVLDLGWASPALQSLAIESALDVATLDLTPLATTQLTLFNLRGLPALTTLDIAPLAQLPLRRLALANVGVEKFSFQPLSSCETLESLEFVAHATRFVDITPLAKLPALARLEVDSKDAPILSAHVAKSITSPAVRAWKAAGSLTIE
jgi:hypothetical protein